MENEKILLAVPTYDGKLYCQQQWLEQVENLSYPVDVLIIDNSHTSDNANTIRCWAEKTRLNVTVEYLEPLEGESIKYVLARSMDIIRKVLITGSYTHWFSLETDVFVPSNIIEYLLCYEKRFIGVPYFHGTGINSFLMDQDFICSVNNRISDIAIPKRSFLKVDGTLKTAYQGGIGCCLVERSVFMNIPFRVAENPVEWFPDAYFHEDCMRAGIPYYITTNIFADHQNDAKRWAEVQKKR